MGGRGDLTDEEWEWLRPLLPEVGRRGGRWRDHRQVIDGVLFRTRTGIQWRDLPERFGPWKTVHERHRRWSADGTWTRLLQAIQARVDAVGGIDWNVSVDSSIVRAHPHAAGARTAPPPIPPQKGARNRAARDADVLRGLVDRLAEVVRQASDSAVPAAGSARSSTCAPKGNAGSCP